MNPGRSLARIFINVFGITQPTEKEEGRATIFINSLILLILAFCVAAGYFFSRIK